MGLPNCCAEYMQASVKLAWFGGFLLDINCGGRSRHCLTVFVPKSENPALYAPFLSESRDSVSTLFLYLGRYTRGHLKVGLLALG